MRKRPPRVEWHIAESDAEWEAVRAQSGQIPPSLKRYQWAPFLLGLLSFSVGGWLWHREPAAPKPDDAPPPPTVDWGPAERLTNASSNDRHGV